MIINIDTILYICGAITAVAAATAIIIKFLRKSISRISKDVSTEIIGSREEKLFAEIANIRTELENFIEESRDRYKIQKNATIATARERINDSYKFYVSRGSIDPYTLSTLEDVYEAYKIMGGNHLAERQIEELKNLKVDNNYLKE